MELYDYIFKRKSIRKFLPEKLVQEQLTKIKEFAQNIKPLYPEIRTYIDLVDDSGVKGIVAAKAPHYLLIYSEKKEGYLPNAGFLMQQMDLYLSSLELGSCWLGMAKTAIPEKDGLGYVIMLAFGKPQESPHRSEISEFNRKTLSEIGIGADERLEAVRLAPSATNSQPWYFVCESEYIYVYRKKLGLMKAALYETMNQIDMGIGLCHLWLATEKQNRRFKFLAGQQSGPQVDGYACIGAVEEI